jgi:Kef-type K+ transport system membrane component KefB/mannitol/fructose-specific phosphotransferase system IIA component (Ntr-type)
LALAVILVAGLVAGAIAKKARLPSVTGQIAVGVILGPVVAGLFHADLTHSLKGLTEFALALISVSVGLQLRMSRLRHAGRRLGLLAIGDTLATLTFVFLAAWQIGGVSWPVALILGAVAIETSPGTVLSVVRETRSRGVFVRTLVAAVAASDVACIVVFELAHTAGKLALGSSGAGGMDLVFSPLKQLSLAAAIGGGCGAAYLFACRRLSHVPQLANASLLAVLFAWGLAHWAEVSSILACVLLGVVLANFSRSADERNLSAFAAFEPAIFAVFFTLAGLHLDFDHVASAGILVLLVFVARTAGKVVGARVALKLAGTTRKIRQYMGLAMLPHASIAVGLLLLIQQDPAFDELSGTILAVGLGVVALSEVFGPIGTRYALSRAEEMGKREARVLDFLQEADIVINFSAGSKEEALRRLARHLITSHQLSDSDAFTTSVLEREAEVSTCVGSGLMIPHGELPEGSRMFGAMAICPEGLDFETPDGKSVNFVVLLGTPPSQRDRHLAVLAALSRAFGSNHELREELLRARTPAHAAELLHDEASTSFNYFLDQGGDAAGLGTAR